VLKSRNLDFSWETVSPFLFKMFEGSGLSISFEDKSKPKNNVKKAFVKAESLSGTLSVKLPHARHPYRKIKVKLEVDTNPPKGSVFETSYFRHPDLLRSC